MEVDGCFPEEIPSLSKKRKFLDESKDQQHSSQVSKYTRQETPLERHPFSKQSVQENVLYTHTRKGKLPLRELDDYTQDSDTTHGESLCQNVGTKSDVYAKRSSYDESSSSSSQICSVSSTMVDGSSPGDDEAEGIDEFGQCLEYLASACDDKSNKGLADEDHDELYSNGFITGIVSAGSLMTEQESHLNSGSRVTIDQEFEQYFSMLMM